MLERRDRDLKWIVIAIIAFIASLAGFEIYKWLRENGWF